ncbi:MAG TPA: hypothetical protein VJ787_11775 [Thermoleophilia bacterium]|nr:MAG: hypothetical protein A2V88_15355 [Elusimicrobia bacterium RBG_16_66_12]HJW76325.1 hypothetical protein [Thermoleophilia bacterium]
MSDQLRPPPFPVARDTETEPGLGETPREAQLRGENVRLRRERNQARKERDAALLGTSAPGTGSTPPDLTRGQRTVRGLLAGTKYAVLLPVVAFAGRAAARKWPEVQELVDAVLGALGL